MAPPRLGRGQSRPARSGALSESANNLARRNSTAAATVQRREDVLKELSSQTARAEVLQSTDQLSASTHNGPSPLGSAGAPVDVHRRAAVLSACGAGAILWLGTLNGAPRERAIQGPAVTVPLEQAEASCMEAAAVCSTVYAQLSSTLRQLSAGYFTPELFQSTCERRLGSPFFLDAITTLQDAVPVIGNALAYAPDLSGTGWLAAAAGKPRIDAAQRERFETLTLSTLQRARRVVRLGTAMRERKYTPAGVQLLTHDVKFLSSSVDELALAVAQVRAQQHR